MCACALQVAHSTLRWAQGVTSFFVAVQPGVSYFNVVGCSVTLRALRNGLHTLVRHFVLGCSLVPLVKVVLGLRVGPVNQLEALCAKGSPKIQNLQFARMWAHGPTPGPQNSGSPVVGGARRAGRLNPQILGRPKALADLDSLFHCAAVPS